MKNLYKYFIIILFLLFSCDGYLKIEVHTFETIKQNSNQTKDSILQRQSVPDVLILFQTGRLEEPSIYPYYKNLTDNNEKHLYQEKTDSLGQYLGGEIVPPCEPKKVLYGKLFIHKDGYSDDSLTFNHSSTDSVYWEVEMKRK